MNEQPLLRVEGLHKHFAARREGLRRPTVVAVEDVSLTLDEGETLGLVGESGSGKSTAGRLILRLIEPTHGRVYLDGRDVTGMRHGELRRLRRDAQMIFQDPYSSLDPAWSVRRTLGEPLRVHTKLSRADREARAAELLERVGLLPEHLDRHPDQFSGGQRQRIAIARAIALEPRLVVCDEPVSALDVSTQAQVVSLLQRLQAELGVAYLFIGHDLPLVRRISHRIAVMYLGRIVELGPASEVLRSPRHPYTDALLAASPIVDPRRQRARQRVVVHGEPPSPLDRPSGCAFHTRCPHAMDRCRVERPALTRTAAGVDAACHLHAHGPRLAGAPVSALPSIREADG